MSVKKEQKIVHEYDTPIALDAVTTTRKAAAGQNGDRMQAGRG